jgi:hypothetical protein
LSFKLWRALLEDRLVAQERTNRFTTPLHRHLGRSNLRSGRQCLLDHPLRNGNEPQLGTAASLAMRLSLAAFGHSERVQSCRHRKLARRIPDEAAFASFALSLDMVRPPDSRVARMCRNILQPKRPGSS